MNKHALVLSDVVEVRRVDSNVVEVMGGHQRVQRVDRLALGGHIREDDATLLPMVAQDRLHKEIYIITLNKTNMHNMGCLSVSLSVCLSCLHAYLPPIVAIDSAHMWPKVGVVGCEVEERYRRHCAWQPIQAQREVRVGVHWSVSHWGVAVLVYDAEVHEDEIPAHSNQPLKRAPKTG